MFNAGGSYAQKRNSGIKEVETPTGQKTPDHSRGEVDFILQLNGNAFPLEVKAAENLQAKSLRSYFDRFSPKLALRTSLSGYRREDWLVNIPLYAVHTISNIVSSY